MTAPLRELTPEQLDVLQLVHNYGTLQGVLDHSEPGRRGHAPRRSCS